MAGPSFRQPRIWNEDCPEVFDMSIQRMAWAAAEGIGYPRGVSWIEEEQAYNFVLYSKHAETVTLLLYGEDDIKNACFTYTLDYLKNKTGRAWQDRKSVV